MTPLHLASWGGHAEVIKVLLGAGANGDARTKEGEDSPEDLFLDDNGHCRITNML